MQVRACAEAGHCTSATPPPCSRRARMDTHTMPFYTHPCTQVRVQEVSPPPCRLPQGLGFIELPELDGLSLLGRACREAGLGQLFMDGMKLG